MSNKITIEQAINHLSDSLKNNPYYFQGWQANIAMSFYDEYNRNNKAYKNKGDIHEISNEAAKNFLNLLIKTT